MGGSVIEAIRNEPGVDGIVAMDLRPERLEELRREFGDSEQCMTSKLVEESTWTREEDSRYFHNEADQNRDIVRRVLNHEPPATPARDALETMRLVFAAEQSATSGEIVRLENVG